MTGTAETAAAPFWRLLLSFRPDLRMAVIRRPIVEAVESWMRVAPASNREAIAALFRNLDRKLDQIETRVPGVLSVTFDELKTEPGCRKLYEHCLGEPFDAAWWGYMARLNIQIDIPALLRYAAAYGPALMKLVRQAKQQELAAMARRPRVDPAGVTFQTEPFESWYRDARPLFQEHMVRTNQDVEDYEKKNIPLLGVMDRLGLLQIMTARCNGRMAAYLMTVVGPSLDDRVMKVAEHMPFFASPDFPGLGGKLLRAANDALVQRGVSLVVSRAGHRGSGPRLGILYRRQGYEEFGQLYKLDLKAA
jgi:hypothetical protein